jgi:FG-GAP repeat protein
MSRASEGPLWARVMCALVVFLPATSSVEAARVFVERQKIVPPTPFRSAHFGSSIAVSGDTVLIGAPEEDPDFRNRGAAYVYVRTGGTWSLQARLTADEPADFRHFGWAVALDGDTALVGEPRRDYDTGAVYVFTRTGTVWTLQDRLESDDRTPGQWFGSAVALNEDTAVIGAPSDFASTGAAYVFVRYDGVLVQQARLVAPDGQQRDEFGTSVGVHGRTAIVGAPRALAASGAVYAFERGDQGWVFEEKLRAPFALSSDQFGYSVAIDDATALIGAPYRNPNGFGPGSVVTFARPGESWPDGVKHVASDGHRNDIFGFKVAIDGDSFVVGAMFEDDGSADAEATGAVYSFTRSGGAWLEQAKLIASDALEGDFLGSSVGVVGTTALVGASHSDAPGGLYDAGAVYVFKIGPVRDVLINVKPESFPNVVNLANRGVLPVGILGGADFPVDQIDLSSLRFGPDRASPAHDPIVDFDNLNDVNLDGYRDLVVHFRTQDLGLDCETESLVLSGETLSGQLFQGADTIVIVGCRRFYLPYWAPDERESDTRRGDRVDIEPK